MRAGYHSAMPARRPGRPSKLDAVVAERDGQPVTASDAILDRLRVGAYREEAARSVGVSKVTLYNWLLNGARHRQRLLAGDRLTAEQRRYVAFLNAVEEAEAQAMLTDWSRLAQLGAGGIPQVTTTVTEKVVREPDAQGRIVERVVERNTSTKTSHTLPDAQVLMWRLERRWPRYFGRRPDEELVDRQEVDAAVDDTRQRAASLTGELRAYLAGIEDGAQQPHPNGDRP